MTASPLTILVTASLIAQQGRNLPQDAEQQAGDKHMETVTINSFNELVYKRKRVKGQKPRSRVHTFNMRKTSIFK